MLVSHPEYIGKVLSGFKTGIAQIERPPTFGAVSPQPAKLAGLFLVLFLLCANFSQRLRGGQGYSWHKCDNTY
jgi:hypothetical protein